MKKFLLITSLIIAAPLGATMVYDPVTNQCWSEPRSPNISQIEYTFLAVACNIIEKNIETANRGILPAKKVVLDQVFSYLKNVGTLAALRLMADLKEDRIVFPNGTYMSPSWIHGETEDYYTLMEMKNLCEIAGAQASLLDPNYHSVKMPSLLPNLY